MTSRDRLTRRRSLHPVARGLGAALGVAGALLAKSPLDLFLGWLILLPLLLRAADLWRAHVRFVLVVMLPIAASLLIVWWWLVGAAPGAPVGSAPADGRTFALTVSLRLLLLASITQLTLLTIPAEELIYTLRQWGLRRKWLIIVLGCFTLGAELQRRAGDVVTARLARGLVPRLTFASRVRQIPYLLRPLLAWVLRSAVERSETWEHRRLAARVEGAPAPPVAEWRASSMLVVGGAAVWAMYNLLRPYVLW